jgi:hypothetical protein
LDLLVHLFIDRERLVLGGMPLGLPIRVLLCGSLLDLPSHRSLQPWVR